MIDNGSAAKVLEFAKSERQAQNKRKSGINRNRFGSVRNVNGKVSMDFPYLGDRVREGSGLPWNDQNKRLCREALDNIYMMIKDGSFRFADRFPESKRRDLFTALERERLKIKLTPNDVFFGDYLEEWFVLKEKNGTVTGRTLRDYKSYGTHYLKQYFGKMSFDEINANLEKFIVWARDRKFRGKSVKFESIKKYFIVLKMICDDAAISFQWRDFNPFFGFKGFRGRKDDALGREQQEEQSEDIDEEVEVVAPFSIDEVRRIRYELPEHWKPFFDFAVSAGLRPGEQIALKPHSINWNNGTMTIRRAMTLDAEGKPIEGRTKNKYSRRIFRLTRAMRNALTAQKEIHDRFGCNYFFCSPKGCQVDLSNFRNQVWVEAMKRAGIKPYRPFRQTRHTFATLAISRGEDLSWIAKVMGHANTQMIHLHYARFIENANGTVNGSKLDGLFETNGNNE
jgi:integrase